jgi:hypothetical protein
MINRDNIQLIRHLKLKPKQGVFDLAAKIAQSAGSLAGSLKAADDSAVQALRGFDKLRGMNEELAQSLINVTAQSLKLENSNKDLNVSFGITSIEAAKLSMNYAKLAQGLGISHDNAKKYGTSLKSIVPTLNQNNKMGDVYYQGLVAVQKVMTTNLGLTADQAEEYTYYATQQGKNAASALLSTQAISNALDPSGDMGYFKIASAGVAKAGSTIQLQYGKLSGNLELAVLKAHSLGLEVKHLAQMGTHLLDIESSIGDELEYQLLSGHRLTDASGKSLTNAYRTATMQGKASDQADIMNKLLEDEGDVLNNNLFARQQMAKLMGIEEGELSRALQKKKLLEKSGAEHLFKFKGDELRQQAEAAGLTAKAVDELMKMEDNRTADEIMREELEISQESLMADYLQVKQLDLIRQSSEAILKNAGKKGGYDKGGAGAIPYMSLIDDQTKKLGKLLLEKQVLTDANVVTIGEKMTDSGGSSKSNANPAGETIIEKQDALLINDGLINFNPRDQFMQVNDGTMIAGTNVDGNKKFASALNGQGSKMTSGQVSQLVQSIEAMGALMAAAVNTQTKALKNDNLFGSGINNSTWS